MGGLVEGPLRLEIVARSPNILIYPDHLQPRCPLRSFSYGLKDSRYPSRSP
jgi:hypothetical protein